MNDFMEIFNRLLIGQSKTDKTVTVVALVMTMIFVLLYFSGGASATQELEVKKCPEITIKELFEDFGSTESEWKTGNLGKIDTVTVTSSNENDEQIIATLAAKSGHLLDFKSGGVFMNAAAKKQLINKLCKQATKKRVL